MGKIAIDIAGFTGIGLIGTGVALQWGYPYGMIVVGSLLLVGAALAARRPE